MTSLDLIRTRRADIARQRADLERQDSDLAIAEKVLLSLEGGATEAPDTVQATGRVGPSRRDKVIAVLTEGPVWMTSQEINAAIAKAHGEPIKGSSLFPMLTTLKNEDVIVRQGNQMALRSRISEEEANLIGT